ncbi:uncharacterized protein [Aquarana catesbeiana]|uniref:uncharacterized protein isoform X2 n=1 Tax=Aquarana catesbeiana TaxID=8400 RepID=UPI003CCA6062
MDGAMRTGLKILHVICFLLLLRSVKPETSMQYMRHIKAGFWGSVFCNVINFYPEEVEIRWVKLSKGIITSSSLDADVSLTEPIRNSDGTFNVTSDLTVRPYSRDEPGDEFFCIVSHRSLKEEISLDFTVPRWSPVNDIIDAMELLCYKLIPATIILDTFFKHVVLDSRRLGPWIHVFLSALYISLTLLNCFLSYFTEDSGDQRLGAYFSLCCSFMISLIPFASFGRLLWKYFRTEWEYKVLSMLPRLLVYFLIPLMVNSGGDITVSEISGDYSIPHMKRTTLTCQITDFRQKEIQINVYLKRLNDEKHLITSWESWGDNSHILPPLEEGAASRTLLPVEMEVKIRNCWTEMYECLCSITITPSADTDDGAVLYVEVEHASLTQPISVHRTLNVYSEVGDLTVPEISEDYSIAHMKRTTLTCQITDFRQKEIQINVYLKRLNDEKHLIASWESRGDNSHILPPLEEGAASRTLLPVEMEVKIRNCWTEMYECLCSITITPSADTDDGAVLYVEVEHASLTQPISVHRTLNVYSEVGD